MCYRLQPMKNKRPQQQRPEPETVSCHVRFPKPVYDWLARKAEPQFKSVQQVVIEIALKAQHRQSQDAA
jgi:hypothetical protein